MHTLVLDIGNTAVKAGCFADGVVRETVVGLSAAQTADLVRRWQPQRILLASVAADAALTGADLQALVPTPIQVFRPGTTAVPLRNAYATPATLGADRLAAAVGAAALHPGRDVLIIDAGTALKLDLVTADGTYHGGSIAPGLGLRLRALHHFTGRLPLLELPDPAVPVQLTGDSTASSMLSGVLNGAAAEVSGLLAQYRGRFPALRVVLTGGDAPQLRARLLAGAGRIFVVPELVLIGLNRILAYNVDE